ncbi:hypothetical protein [Malaciobacter mytili]|uniref:Type II secretion system protein n=1 Tax=Malaciobacter mytili LMG 24559 TaxID=1032238 RepID=A0AAX2AHM5_9BACT|nr:hypothetical protein [Malaciobacter mytili]AXH14278.1 hypothetical protein AMYT_0684 [Malaciobacter mytili LMG 24559]RXI40806.1 hypothetical protein CRU99_10065 [Malaciobacter mytili]RXK16502.1 hypothetical protein CP985_02830 [Malaciobacter mytili LMG 24559]
MKKQSSLVKNSFTLFETLLSLTLLAIVISLVYKLTYYDSFTTLFETLNNIENSFTLKKYDKNFTIKEENLEVITNNSSKTISVKKVIYKDKNILLYKYEPK